MLYWGVGMHLGKPWAQNKHGHLLGDVTDQGKRGGDPYARGNEIGEDALPFHCDGSDLVGLLCLARPASGGLSLVANSVKIHNDLVRTRPDIAEEFYKPQPHDFRGEEKPGAPPWYVMPVFTSFAGPALHPLHRPLHRGVPAPRRRAAPHAACEGRPRSSSTAWPTIPKTTSRWISSRATCSS